MKNPAAASLNNPVSTKKRTKNKDVETRQELGLRLGRNVAARRRLMQMTQAQLAELLDVETVTITRFEGGKHLPSLETLSRLAGLLNATVAELLAEDSPNAGAGALSSWLMMLDEPNREFVREQMIALCRHLAGHQQGKPEAA